MMVNLLWTCFCYSSAIVFGLCLLPTSCDSFVAQRRTTVERVVTTRRLQAQLPTETTAQLLLGDKSCGAHSLMQLLLTTTTAAMATTDDTGMQDAFQDEISWADGPVRIMGLAFVTVILLLTGLKVVVDQTDTAIKKVLADSEEALKRYHPQRWAKIEEELQGFTGDDRYQKLIAIMESLEEQEPELMSQVKDRINV